MQRVLVTAGNGTIGREVSLELQRSGYEPVIFDTRDTNADDNFPKHIRGRATDRQALLNAAHGCMHILHLEWSGSVLRTTQEPLATNHHNTNATLNALEVAKQLEIPLTFTSTSVYKGDTPAPLQEIEPTNEKSLYVVQKLYGESCARAYSLMFGMSTCSLRVFNVYAEQGGSPFQIVPRIRNAFRTGQGMQLTGDGGQRRDFTHARDVARFFVATVGKRFNGDIFNVGTGIGTSMLELLQLSMHVTGKDLPIEFIPAMGEEARYLIADMSKSHDALGVKAETSLEEGLSRALIGA